MDSVDSDVMELVSHGRLASDPDGLPSNGRSLLGSLSGCQIDAGAQFDGFTEVSELTLTIGLIDSYRFSRECLTKALADLQPNAVVIACDTVENCAAERHRGIDLVIFYSHSNGVSDAATLQNIAAVATALPNVPLVVLSDAEDAQQLKTVCSTLKCGARGIIATRTTGISIANAAIRLVRAGGTFAPMDMLLSNRPERIAAVPDAARQTRLTSRQMLVLSHVERGHANKTIAHELSMSESTVKVHVRNIMRKLGATNRTQAVYKAQNMSNRDVTAKSVYS